MKNHIVKRVLIWVLTCLLLLLWGCGQTPPLSDTTPPATTETVPPATTADTSPEPIDMVKDWLDQDFAFKLSLMYMEFTNYGFSQDTDMLYATDGSYSMVNYRKNWNHSVEQETEETAEFYYRYENNELVCYTRVGAEDFTRSVLTVAVRQDMDKTRPLMAGTPALLPDYLQNLTLTETAEAATFTYQLPLEAVLSDNTMLATFVGNAFDMSGAKYDEAAKLIIGCTLETDPGTYRPRSFVFDFSQIKPLVLSDSSLSAEYAFETDLMTMTYTLDFALPSSVTIPEEALKLAPV